MRDALTSSGPRTRSIWMDEWDRIHPPGAAAAMNSASSGRADAVIVGAGLTGLTLAYRLASSGYQVFVFDGQQVGHGASLRNAGFCTASAPFSAAAAIERHGAKQGTALLRWFYDGPGTVRRLLEDLGADAAWTDSVRLVLARTPAEARRLNAEAQALSQALGRPIEVLDAGEIERHCGFGAFASGLRDTGSASLNPAQLLAALLKGCVQAGVQVRENTGVHRIARAKSGYRIEHAGGVVEARNVVIATGGYTGRLGVDAHRLTVQVGSYIAASHPLDPAVRARLAPVSTLFSTAGRFPNYFRLTPDGRLLFGGRRSLSYESQLPAVAAELMADVRRVLPGLDVQLDRCWGGRLAFSPDREPVLGPLDEGLYVASGYCGHGVPTSVACANELADQMLGRRGAEPIVYRPRLNASALPQLASFFLPAISAYYRVRDGLDATAARLTHARSSQ